MVLAAVALLVALTGHQETPDLSTDPRLQQKVDVHMKRVLLPDLLHYLKVHSNQRFLSDLAMNPLMVCVFADKQPLWLVMKDVAEVVGGQWKDLGSGWRLAETLESKRLLRDYVEKEQQTLRGDVLARARALSQAASKHRWVEVATTSDSPLLTPPDDPTPEQWAQARLHDPAYFVAGLMFERTKLLEVNGRKFDAWDGFGLNGEPTAYRLIAPPNADVDAVFQCSAAGEEAAGLEGTQICARSLPWCGTLQSIVVGSGSRPENFPKHLIRYPRPVGKLADTKEGKWLLAWDTPLDESDDLILGRRVGGLSPQPSAFFSGGQGIEDYLEALADSLKVPVVSDGFRVPVIGKDPATGDSVRRWLTSLRARQGCFVHVQSGSICVRHGGFWDLRRLEIPEDVLRPFESIPQPGLDDYADFAFEQGIWGNFNGTSIMPFFETQDVPLTLFDSSPLRTSPVALAAYGQLTEQQRKHVLSGGFINWYRDIANDLTVTHHDNYAGPPKNPRKIVFHETDYMNTYQGADYFINFSALWGIFYGAMPVGREMKLLESCVGPSNYRDFWGDDLDKSEKYVREFDPIFGYYAHFFSLRDIHLKSPASAEGSPRRLYGTFSFFSAENNVDGVITKVDIPYKSGQASPLPATVGSGSGGG